MRMKYFLDGKEKSVQLARGSTVMEMLKKLDINPEKVIVRIDGKIVTEDVKVRGKVELLRVFSGG